jgi:hypothetical protein
VPAPLDRLLLRVGLRLPQHLRFLHGAREDLRRLPDIADLVAADARLGQVVIA